MQTPMGTRDILPEELERIKKLELFLNRKFKAWGYQQVETPLIESVEILTQNLGPSFLKKIFMFQDFNGELIALRPEMTIPITRLVATRYPNTRTMIRLFYTSSVFRFNQTYIERRRQFRQAGVELLGSTKPEADGEIIALLVEALDDVGISNYRIDINFKGLFEYIYSIVSDFSRNPNSKFDIDSNNKRLYLERLIEQSEWDSEEQKYLLTFIKCSTLDDISKIPRLNFPVINRIIEKACVIQSILNEYNCTNEIFFDLSLTKSIEYYSDLIFEVTVPELGITLGGGGRFNNLLEKFNNDNKPGIGFALEIEKLVTVLQAQNPERLKSKRMRVQICGSNTLDTILLAKQLRKLNCDVAVNIDDIDSLTEISTQEIKFDFIIFLNKINRNDFVVYNSQADRSEFVTFQEIKEIAEGL